MDEHPGKCAGQSDRDPDRNIPGDCGTLGVSAAGRDLLFSVRRGFTLLENGLEIYADIPAPVESAGIGKGGFI